MHENEVLALLLGLCVLGFVVIFHRPLRQLPAPGLLLLSYCALQVAWVATVAEHFLWYPLFNLVEHLGYAGNGILMAAWFWRAAGRGDQEHDVD